MVSGTGTSGGGPVGLTAEQADFMSQALMGGETSTAKGGVSYGVALADGRLHAVLVTDLSDKAVTFWDPADGQTKHLSLKDVEAACKPEKMSDAAKAELEARLDVQRDQGPPVPDRFNRSM
jgi:hypothetical protein